MDKLTGAKKLRDIAAFLELKEAKVRAYKHGAHAVEISDGDLKELYSQITR